MTGKRLLLVPTILLLGSGSVLLGRHGYLEAKALLADRLLDRALAAHLEDGETHRPWAWADMSPIGRLEVDRLHIRRHIVSGASGSSMAFGLGHVDGTAAPNSAGNCVLAGHRSSFLAFLRHLRPGERVRVETVGRVREYVLESTEVVADSDVTVLEPTPDDRLTLVTCYPFNGLVRSPWRYVATFRPVAVTEPGA
jgi:sortase A